MTAEVDADGNIVGFDVSQSDNNACDLRDDDGNSWTYSTVYELDDDTVLLTGPNGKNWTVVLDVD